MRIDCPFCGPRDSGEFAYRGDATPARPEAPDAAAFVDYVYLRDNVAGPIEEHWYHQRGCRQWLRVRRDTLTHEIQDVAFASEPRA